MKHAFNIVANGDGYVILDTSMPVVKYDNGEEVFRSPYISSNISKQEINDILEGKSTFSGDDYSIVDGEKVVDGKRMYGVNCALSDYEKDHKIKL